MTELLTAAQMRAIEQAAIDSGEVTGLELMERAGRGVVDALLEEWPALSDGPKTAVILCGPGNNGGDGFVVARLLKERGWEVEVFLFGAPEKLPPDARANYERWTALGEVSEMIWDLLREKIHACELSVDAIFGTGMTRGLRGEVWHELYHAVSERRADQLATVAIDIPTGVNSDTGHNFGGAFEAQLTVTFHKPKLGHYLGKGHIECGQLRVADIGLGKAWSKDAATLIGKDLGGRSFLSKSDHDHKYTHGHALVLAGGPGRGGAARLAARGALRIGAGLVTLACPQNAYWENAAQLNAIMVQQLDGVAGLREVLEDDRLNALCLGPGLGLAADTEQLVLAGLNAGRAMVLDADALSRFERKPDVLFEALHKACVLTPHAGEFARVFPDIAERLNTPATKGPAYSKVDATREAAARAGCTVLFKGPDTVIADQTGRCAINSSAYDRAAPWLATAGSGDVLAGFITGLLARGFGPMQAAESAAWLHTECALSFGPGLIAEDLPEELPRVFQSLGL